MYDADTASTVVSPGWPSLPRRANQAAASRIRGTRLNC